MTIADPLAHLSSEDVNRIAASLCALYLSAYERKVGLRPKVQSNTRSKDPWVPFSDEYNRLNSKLRRIKTNG